MNKTFRTKMINCLVIKNRLAKKGVHFTLRMASQLVKVQIKQGTVVGQQKSLPNGNLYQSFQGIPFAVPPIGDLRFKSPLPLENFGVPQLYCLKERDVSYQRDPVTTEVIGSEDCLFLNIYVPKNCEECSRKLPVMVWIHGGGFSFGSGNSDYYLPLSLLQEDVIVVTLNYRLGALGFLYLPEEGVWGNAGLKDQRLALQWIQDNIEAFNGDSNNVTLFGESAGASSVHLHAVSNHANKLFHKAIMQSGTANMEWVFQINAAYKTLRLAELMGIETNGKRHLLEFLQSPQVKPSDITSKSLLVMTADERRRCLPFPFKPVIEDSHSPDSFINQPIWDILKQSNSIKIPSIMGYNSAEGLVMMPHVLKNLEEFENDFEGLIPRYVPLEPDNNDQKLIVKHIKDFYFDGKSITSREFDNLTNLLSDHHFVMGMLNAAEWHAELQQAPLYFYRFEYVGDRNIFKRMVRLDEIAGACHGDELFYLFQMASDDMTFSKRDQMVISQISKLWTNFAKYGNPTPQDEHQLVKCNWSPVKKSHNGEFTLDYLAIDNSEFRMKSNPDEQRLKFWKKIYNLYTPVDLSSLNSKL